MLLNNVLNVIVQHQKHPSFQQDKKGFLKVLHISLDKISLVISKLSFILYHVGLDKISKNEDFE